jgi:hypothetical protein
MMILIDWKLLKNFSKKDPTTMGMAGAADGLLACDLLHNAFACL